jgi:hypothetical protein
MLIRVLRDDAAVRRRVSIYQRMAALNLKGQVAPCVRQVVQHSLVIRVPRFACQLRATRRCGSLLACLGRELINAPGQDGLRESALP